ncbi:poly(U)-specific 3'-to-5' RNA exonuclease [Trapelia coarctata]|nr:poly(U)-specific 3'-to-5' RNA exonuclease [Trapelia coarctata]
MALVEYSDSEESQKEDAPTTKSDGAKLPKSLKRKHSASSAADLPPLPDAFHDLYASAVRVSNKDDPALHGGRQRVTPHIEGNWPTHVYIEWYPLSAESSKLHSLIRNLNGGLEARDAKVKTLLESELGAEMPLHISLSRSLMLSTDERQPFVERLKSALEESVTKPFELHMSGLNWVPNYERTRWFLVLQLAKPAEDGLNALLLASNQTAAAFDKRQLYAASNSHPIGEGARGRGSRRSRPSERAGLSRSPILTQRTSSGSRPDCSSSFHISIAWSLSPPTEEIVARARSVDVSDLQSIRFTVRSIKAKVGNAITALSLESKSLALGGILGK